MIADRIISIASRYLRPFGLVTLDDELRCDMDRSCIAYAVDEEIIGHEIPENEWRSWSHVSDVVRSVARRVPAEQLEKVDG